MNTAQTIIPKIALSVSNGELGILFACPITWGVWH